MGFVIAAGGCIPLPITHMSPVSSASAGVVRHDDGSPYTGLRIGAASDPDPQSCAKSNPSAATDPVGRFALPNLKVKRRIFWLTLMESFGMSNYWICARPAGVADSAPMFSPIRGNFFGVDSISCLEWRWRDESRLACSTQYGRPKVVTGGNWSDSAGTGVYRLIFAALDPKKYRHDRAFLQWVELLPNGEPGAVRTTIELPTEGDVDAYAPPSFARPSDRWQVVVKSMQPTKWGNDRWLTWELGPPGQIMRRPRRVSNLVAPSGRRVIASHPA